MTYTITLYNFNLFILTIAGLLILLLLNAILYKTRRFIGRTILKLEKKGIL
jgi:hypothetical protein